MVNVARWLVFANFNLEFLDEIRQVLVGNVFSFAGVLSVDVDGKVIAVVVQTDVNIIVRRVVPDLSIMHPLGEEMGSMQLSNNSFGISMYLLYITLAKNIVSNAFKTTTNSYEKQIK